MKFNKKQITIAMFVAALACRMYAADDDAGLNQYAQSWPWGSLLSNTSPTEHSASSISPMATSCAHTQAKLMLEHGFYDDSIHLLERIVNYYVDNPYIQAIELFNIGLIYKCAKKEYGKAIESFEQVLRINGGFNATGIQRVLVHLNHARNLLAQEESAISAALAQPSFSSEPLYALHSVEVPVRAAKRAERSLNAEEQNDEGANGTGSKRMRGNSPGRYWCDGCQQSFKKRGHLVAHKETSKHKKNALGRLGISRKS